MATVDQEIHAMERSLLDAMLSADVSALDRITGSDFVQTHASGNVEAKPAWLERYRAAKMSYTKLETSGVEVRNYGNAALVSGRLDMTSVSSAGPTDLSIRFLRVWIRQDGGWRLVAHNSTLLRT